MMYNNWMWGGMGSGFGWIFMVLFWALLIWVIIMIIRRTSGHTGCCGHGEHNDHNRMSRKDNSALQILNDRYAKGEIEKKEYEEKKKDLNG